MLRGEVVLFKDVTAMRDTRQLLRLAMAASSARNTDEASRQRLADAAAVGKGIALVLYEPLTPALKTPAARTPGPKPPADYSSQTRSE